MSKARITFRFIRGRLVPIRAAKGSKSIVKIKKQDISNIKLLQETRAIIKKGSIKPKFRKSFFQGAQDLKLLGKNAGKKISRILSKKKKK